MQIKQVYVSYDRNESPPSGGFRYCPYCRAELALAERVADRGRPARSAGLSTFRTRPRPSAS
jgi:hypothetical protein